MASAKGGRAARGAPSASPRRLLFAFECTRSENKDLHIHAKDRFLSFSARLGLPPPPQDPRRRCIEDSW